MRFRVYQAKLGGKLSSAKLMILERLWNEGDTFPRGWVLSSELLALTKQKYFDRRVRELRDELGCDIQTGSLRGQHAYRLVSVRVLVANPRAYLSASDKLALFERAKYHCAVCGRQFLPGLRGLQADHKVPLSRGGQNESENWQPLCVECNVAKRRACAGCDYDCSRCPWAYPDKTGRRVQITLSSELESQVKELARRSKVPVQELLIDAIAALARQSSG